MAAIIGDDRLVWGIQLPIQSQSTLYVQPWEAEAGPDELARVARACDDAGAFYVLDPGIEARFDFGDQKSEVVAIVEAALSTSFPIYAASIVE